MYTWNDIKRGLTNPRLIRRELHNQVFNIHHYFNRSLLGRRGIDLMEEDWDNLIILDACRYDMFAECNTICGELDKIISSGSSTRELIETTYQGQTFPETVYVSANAQIERHDVIDNFHAVKRLWIDRWDDELATVTPNAITEATLETEPEYPNKRLISHFVQPHYPFIGEFGKSIDHHGFSRNGMYDITDSKIWHRLRDGDIDEQLVWDAYVENLEIAMPHVERLVNELDGKTVVTSDHGNVLGKWGHYGHPHYRYLKELVEVPWFVPEYKSRKDIIEGDLNKEKEERDSDIVDERLKALGYQD